MSIDSEKESLARKLAEQALGHNSTVDKTVLDALAELTAEKMLKIAQIPLQFEEIQNQIRSKTIGKGDYIENDLWSLVTNVQSEESSEAKKIAIYFEVVL